MPQHASHPDDSRDRLSKYLINPEGTPRYVSQRENRRVEELLDVEYADPYAGESRLARIARRVLARTTKYQPKESEPIPRPYLEESQQRQQADITRELDISREIIRNNRLAGVDDVIVDQLLGLRSDESILPGTLREWHRQAEEAQQQEISFLTWMTDYATNEQLLNVWQWHDAYLKELDEKPEFQERIANVKAGYSQGLQKAIAEGQLPPDVAIDKAHLDEIQFIHGSPLSTLLAAAHAYVDRPSKRVQLREGVSNFTLYHEITHTLIGLHPSFDEALTDMMAATIYNNVHENPDDKIDPHEHLYADQIATIEALGRMTGSSSVLYEFIRIGSGPDRIMNSIALIQYVDTKIGLPIMSGLLGQLTERMARHEEAFNSGVSKLTGNFLMRQWAEFLEEMIRDESGRITTDILRILKRIADPTTSEHYGEAVAYEGAMIMVRVAQFQHELDVGNDSHQS